MKEAIRSASTGRRPTGDAENSSGPMTRGARFVLPALFESLTGYTTKAVQRKIESGIWLEGREYVKAPDGRRLIDMEGYQKWVLSGRNS